MPSASGCDRAKSADRPRLASVKLSLARSARGVDVHAVIFGDLAVILR